MRIGVDVGGTNTDAVLMDGNTVVSWVKTPTSGDIGTGVVGAINDVLGQAQCPTEQITNVMIGTTQFTNAFVEGRNLVEVAVFRAALPATASVQPLLDFSPRLAGSIGRHIYLVPGGYEFDGREIAELNEKAVAAAARDVRAKGITSAAISCVFSPINNRMERRVAEILRNEVPGIRITLSSNIGRVGLIERENATIMNASLSTLSHKVMSAFADALDQLGIQCPLHVSQNDGTLMSARHARDYPVLTFASGPTNSMRGAAFLSGVSDGVVVDIGGTTTDVGVLIGGFPRESAVSVDIGSVRTNFRMPDILAIGLGGGSIVRPRQPPSIGPESVGYELTAKSVVFGGDVLTATDIAVAMGYADIGDRSRVARLPTTLLESASDTIHVMVEEAVDRIKSSRGDTPAILVGGGSILINRDLKGTSKTVRPDLSNVANAIGAALSQVGGEVDRVYSYNEIGRDEAIHRAKREACERAIAAGASEDSTAIVSLEELPLSYLPAGAVRVKAKAVGELP